MLNLVCYVSLCRGLRAGAGSLSYNCRLHVDCSGLSTIVIKTMIIVIIYYELFWPQTITCSVVLRECHVCY